MRRYNRKRELIASFEIWNRNKIQSWFPQKINQGYTDNLGLKTFSKEKEIESENKSKGDILLKTIM